LGHLRGGTMHRFFVPADCLKANPVTLSGPLAHQLTHVLRLRPGERITLLDNTGWAYEVELSKVTAQQTEGEVRRKTLATGEPRTKITLYQALLKGDHFELVLQKGTELGIVDFVPLISERCVVAHLDQASAKAARWQRIILEAAEQSGRGRLPVLRPATLFAPACEQAGRRGLSLIPWEGEKSTSLRDVLGQRKGEAGTATQKSRPFAINLFIGPEGGFSTAEIVQARGYGLIPVTLGARLLRAETAGLVAATAILYELGDLE